MLGVRRGGAAAAVALLASWLVCLAGIHGVAGKAAMAPHPHQGKVKVRRRDGVCSSFLWRGGLL